MFVERQATAFTKPLALHGEGAYWDAARATWLWVDMLAGRLMVTEVDGTTRALHVPDPIAAAARPVATGEVLLVGERTLWLVHPLEGVTKKLIGLPLDKGCRANEAALTGAGGLAVATMAYDATAGAGSVLIVGPDASISTALRNTTISNGTVFCDDEVMLVDSPTGEIGRYREDGERWTRTGTLGCISAEDGLPDGICVDVEGAVWVALWGGGKVQRWSPEGSLLEVVHVPVTQPTSVALGGVDGRTLLITTSAYQLPDGHGTQAGALFATRVAVPGRIEAPLPQASVQAWTPLEILD